jgi:hypothetical protein
MEISGEYRNLIATILNGKMRDFTDDEWYNVTLALRVSKAIDSIRIVSKEDYEKAIYIINHFKK